jgi:two-component system, LytTR family, sensor kinase
MKDLINRHANFTRIEFWALTTLFVFVIFFFITDIPTIINDETDVAYRQQFSIEKVPFDFYTNYFIPQLIRHLFQFLAFLYLNFIVIPRLLKRERIVRNLFLIALTALVAVILFGVTDTYLKGYLYAQSNSRDAIDQKIFLDASVYTLSLLLGLFIYTGIKYGSIYLLSNSAAINAKYKFITRESIVAFIIWAISLFIIIIAEAERAITAGWATVIPFAISFYLFSFYSLIPQSLKAKKVFLRYIFLVIIIVIIAYIPVSLLLLLFLHDGDTSFGVSLFNSVFQLFITAPVSWVLFKRQIKGNEEIYVLKKELGQTNASFDFLRSQINPHFLFNALNTIYGTAIQEKAERTSEGIERLGDMMRFMLQENLQEKIALAREIEYLNNYISLQRLRTDPNPGIDIQTYIDQEVKSLQIAPMLLIPFVENAFKHGISFREQSHIKITLETKNSTIYFDVYNSIHTRPENDPEKNKSGIGLNNVKQRLQLLYPQKHELIIRETGKEFFVHLTIQLAPFA